MNSYDINDQVRLSASFTNSAGAATDPTAVTLALTNPAGTTTTYTYGVDAALVKDSTGNYHLDATPTTAGYWTATWAGTGAIVQAETEVFFVRYGIDNSLYARLAVIKAELGMTDTTLDPTLTDYISQASRAIDAYCGRRFYTTANDETRVFDVPPRWTDDILLDLDLYSLTSITNGDGTVIAATQYQLLPNNKTPKWGIRLKWRSRDTVWEVSADGDYEAVILVTGKWGYSATAPAPIQKATVTTIKAWYNIRQTAGIRSQSIDNYSVSFADAAKGELPEGVKADLMNLGYVRMRLA